MNPPFICFLFHKCSQNSIKGDIQSSNPHEKGLIEDGVRLINACISGKLLATPLKCQPLHEPGCSL